MVIQIQSKKTNYLLNAEDTTGKFSRKVKIETSLSYTIHKKINYRWMNNLN